LANNPRPSGTTENAEADAFVGRNAGKIAAREYDAAGQRADDTADGLDQRGFPGAVRTDEADDLAFADAQADIVDRRRRP